MASPPRIVVTPGEPAGIGPDLCIALAQETFAAQIIVCADIDLMRQRAHLLNRQVNWVSWSPDVTALLAPGSLYFVPVKLASAAKPGRIDVRNATYVLQTLRTAVELCVSRQVDAMVTGPVQKSVINDAGIAFSGHTEFLAELTHAPQPVMMLETEGLRVALVTTHLPVSQIAAAITSTRVETVVRVLHHDLKTKYGIAVPRIVVCGLNPHAGEDGHLGREEIDIITPVLEKLRREGMQLVGPLPADTLFTPKNLQHTDAVLAMYHDQGLPVLKYAGFGNAINVTLGLPIIRTSVDHGTALDLAGTGMADPSSLRLAITTAIAMAKRRTA